MAKPFLMLMAVLAIPWAIRTWWEMRRAGGPRERAFVARTSLSMWLLATSAAVILGSVRDPRMLVFVLPVITVVGLGVRFSWRRTRARLVREEKDPFSRAKRLN